MSEVRAMPEMGRTEDEKNIDDGIAKSEIRAVEHSPQYGEYLHLCSVYQGEVLARLTKKVDWHVLPQLVLIYLLSYVDRANVGNAKLYNAVKDLNMTDNDWNIGLGIFFITYALGGPFSNLLLRRYGPKKVLPTLLLLVSIVLIGSGCCSNRAAWFALRLLLGLFEAGMFPGCMYTISTWYTPAQIHSRSMIYFCGAPFASATGSLLASGIGSADGLWGYRGWRWIYVCEGTFSGVVALVAFWAVQERPEVQGKWLNEEERRFLVLRNKYAYGSDKSGNSTDFRLKDLIAAAKSWHVWMLSFAFFSNGSATYGLSFTLPTLIKNMGFSNIKAQALSSPPYYFAMFTVLAVGWYGDRYKHRMLALVLPGVMAFIGLLMAIFSVSSKRLIPLTYIGVTLSAGGTMPFSPTLTAWIAINTAGQTKRAAAISIIIVWVQLGGILGSHIYLDSQAPKYPLGFGCSLAFQGFGAVIVPIIYWWMVKRVNAKRDKISEEEVFAKYSAEELEDMGDLSPLYRYEY